MILPVIDRWPAVILSTLFRFYFAHLTRLNWDNEFFYIVLSLLTLSTKAFQAINHWDKRFKFSQNVLMLSVIQVGKNFLKFSHIVNAMYWVKLLFNAIVLNQSTKILCRFYYVPFISFILPHDYSFTQMYLLPG